MSVCWEPVTFSLSPVQLCTGGSRQMAVSRAIHVWRLLLVQMGEVKGDEKWNMKSASCPLHWVTQMDVVGNACSTDTTRTIIRFVISVVFIIKPDCSVCICLTQLYGGRDMYRIYYIKNNYMFRHFTLTIFRLRNEKNLVSSYIRLMWVVYIGEVRGEVGTRSRMCCVITKWLYQWTHCNYRNYIYIKNCTLFIYKLSVHVHIISTNIRWYRRSNYINLE